MDVYIGKRENLLLKMKNNKSQTAVCVPPIADDPSVNETLLSNLKPTRVKPTQRLCTYVSLLAGDLNVNHSRIIGSSNALDLNGWFLFYIKRETEKEKSKLNGCILLRMHDACT